MVETGPLAAVARGLFSCLPRPRARLGRAIAIVAPIVGALVAAGRAHNQLATMLGFIAVICAMINVVGGFIITDRMLRMFKRQEGPK